MSFRQFINEYGGAALSSGGYGANARWGRFGFPSLTQQGLNVRRFPVGGYQNFGQMTQQQINIAQFNDPDYIYQRALEAIAQLTENVASAIEEKQKNPAYVPRHYKWAEMVPPANPVMIKWMTWPDIISGLYPRVKQEDLSRAIQKGVVSKSTDQPPSYVPSSTGDYFYDINITVLKQAMTEMAYKLADKEHGYQSAQHLTGVGDNIMKAAFTPTQNSVQPSHSTSPMG